MKFAHFYFVLCVKVLLSSTTANPLCPKKEQVFEKITPNYGRNREFDSYEITENIIDVPDTRPKLPIVANYSIEKPLNLAKLPNNTNTSEKSNKFTYIEISSEVEDTTKPTINVIDGIKNYIKDLKYGVISGIQGWFKKRIDEGLKF